MTPASSHRRLTVLHVSVPTAGGAASLVLSQVRDQLARGWHVTVACGSDGPLGFEARAAGARVRWWDATPGPGAAWVGEAVALAEVLELVNPDVVHLHGAKAAFVGRVVVRGRVATVVQPHGWAFQVATGASRALLLRWERHAARWSTELVCISARELGAGREAGIRGPAVVVPNGVDLTAFRPQGQRERLAARARLALADQPTVVCVGRLTRHKGQRELLAQWPAIREQVPGAQLVLVGDGPDRDLLIRQADRLPGIAMAGRRGDVALWYAAADVVVAPSRWEAMSLVPLEAMASARSVVATDVTGMGELVPPEAGEVVPLGDVAALGDAVVRRLRDPGLAEDEGWNGRSHVELHHDEVRAAHDLSRVYLRLVAAYREQARTLPARAAAGAPQV